MAGPKLKSHGSSVDSSPINARYRRMDIRQKLARNPRLLRAEKQWSQQTLGVEAELHRTYISDLERGARSPRIKTIEKLAEALNGLAFLRRLPTAP